MGVRFPPSQPKQAPVAQLEEVANLNEIHYMILIIYTYAINMRRKDILEREAEIRQWIKEHRSKAFICKQLHCKPVTLESYLSRLGISYKGNKGSKGRKSAQLKPAIAYLYKGSNIKSHKLKLKLIRDGIKTAQCESCKLSYWFDKPIPLELHHLNGDRFDNRLDNLKILCPNCHAMTENHAGKAAKKENINIHLKKSLQQIEDNKINNNPVSILVFENTESYVKWKQENQALQNLINPDNNSKIKHKNCLYCNSPLTGCFQDMYCSRKCYWQASRKVERPSKEKLQQLIWKKPTTQLAKDFGVSDKAIEKWCKAYEINKPPRGYWTKLNQR